MVIYTCMCKLVIFVTWNRDIIDICLTLLIKIIWISFETVSCNWINESSYNRTGMVMVSKLPSSALDHGFEPRSGQTKDFKIGICCFSAKHTVLRRKSKYWLAQNQNNVSEWSDMSTCRLLFQWASTIKIQLGCVCLVQSEPHLKLTCSHHDIHVAENLLNWH